MDRVNFTQGVGKETPMESQRISSGKTSFGNRVTGQGQFSNDYVRKLMAEKLAEYELKLEAMRQGQSEELKQTKDTKERGSPELSLEDKKILSEFLELKIENLRNILGYMSDQNSQGELPKII